MYGVGIVQGRTEKGVLVQYNTDEIIQFKIGNEWPVGSQFNKPGYPITILEIPEQYLKE